MSLAAGLLLDLRGIKQGCDDRGRTDADRNARFHQLRAPLLAGFIPFVIFRHSAPLKLGLTGPSIGRRAAMEAAL